jgi:hypothetical protein
MKVIIAGKRDFNDYEAVKQTADFLLSNQTEVEIVSGGAKGADALGEQYAKEKGYKLTPFPADWNKHGKKAGPIRNEQMAKYADALIAFWDGESKGTKNMIDLAKQYNLKYHIYKITP